MGKRVNPAGGRSRRGTGAAVVQSAQHPGPTRPSAGRPLGTGARWGRGYEGQGAEKRQRGARARLPERPPSPSTILPEAAGRAGAVPGVGGEEAGPPHWLLSTPPARSQRERSFGQLRGAGAGAQRSPICPRSGLTGSRALPRETDDGGRCRRMRHGPAAPAAAFAAPGGEC